MGATTRWRIRSDVSLLMLRRSTAFAGTREMNTLIVARAITGMSAFV
jgi:hypothetical protein